MKAWFFILIIFIFFFSVLTSAQTNVNTIEQIRAEIEQIQMQVDDVKNQIKLNQNDINKLNDSIKQLTIKEQQIKNQLEKVTSAKIETERLISDLKGRLLEVENRLLLRIRALYMESNRNQVALVLSSSSSSNYERVSYYVSKIRQFDDLEIEQITTIRKQQGVETNKLKVLIKQQSDLLATSAMQRKEQQERKNKAQSIANELVNQKKVLQQKLLALRAQELRFESLLSSLTSGQSSLEQPKNSLDVKSQEFKGLGFPKQKLGLNFVSKIVAKFGSKPTGASLPLKGIKIKCKPNFSVSLPLSGQVGFVGKMPLIGQVVIIDHGNRDYTLIGGLDIIKVEKNQIMPANSVIGESLSEVYLETRKAGKAIDPILIYKAL